MEDVFDVKLVPYIFIAAAEFVVIFDGLEKILQAVATSETYRKEEKKKSPKHYFNRKTTFPKGR